MHIPDGYLSPQTYVPAYAAMVPIWAVASAKLNKSLRQRQMPLLALGAAFSFLIMMFNVPIPGGSTGHAAGGVLIAILLGPWAATMAVSLALIVQAMLFGDGGITAIGANCLNIAVVMPWTGWVVYKLIARRSSAKSRRQWIAGAIGGYVGINAAALTTALMFGVQPLIAHGADGKALYCPYGLGVAVPVMAAEHLLAFGFIEAVVTGLVIAHLQRTVPSMIPGLVIPSNNQVIPSEARNLLFPPAPRRLVRGAIITLLIMLVLTPLGLYLPAKLKAGGAFGEGSSSDVKRDVGYAPREMVKAESRGRAPMPDYAPRGEDDAPLPKLGVYYVTAGALGSAVVALTVVGVGRLRRKA